MFTCQRHLPEAPVMVLTRQCHGAPVMFTCHWHLSEAPARGTCHVHLSEIPVRSTSQKHMPGHSYSPSRDIDTCQRHLSCSPVMFACQRHLSGAPVRVLTRQCQGCGRGIQHCVTLLTIISLLRISMGTEKAAASPQATQIRRRARRPTTK